MLNRPIKLPEAPSLTQPFTELKAGDIVFFTMKPASNSGLMAMSDNFVSLFQSFVDGEGGHANIAHIGLMVDETYEENGETKTRLKMSHLLLTQYKLIDPVNYLSSRTTIVYRPANEEDRKALAAELSDICKEKHAVFEKRLQFRWWIIVSSFFLRFFNALGFRNTALTPSPLPTSDKEHSIIGSSICPKFIVDMYIEASRRLAKKGDQRPYQDLYMNIASSTLLKSFQSYLHNNTNYTCFMLPTKVNTYLQLLTIVEEERRRLAKQTSVRAKDKTKKLEAALANHENYIKTNNITDNYQSALHLTQSVLPVFRENTGWHLVPPTSYRVMQRWMRSQGIYEEFLEPNRVKETQESLADYLTALNYSDKQREIYMTYRGRGFSDSQAQFEAAPTFKKWCDTHVRELALSALSVVGVFGVLAYGKVKTWQTERRNEHYQSPRV